MKNLKTVIAIVSIFFLTTQAFATDVVKLVGKKNRVNLLYVVLQGASQDRDVQFVKEVTNTQSDWTQVYVNGQLFGKVQVSSKMYTKIVKNYINNPESNVPRNEVINYFCNQQTKFLLKLRNSLSAYSRPVEPQVVISPKRPNLSITPSCNTQEAIAQFNNVQLAANANPAAFAQYQQQVVALRQAYPCLPATLMLVRPACIDCNRPQQQDDCAAGLREVYDLKSRYTNFFSFMGLERANRELELIKQRYPCIPRHYRFKRAHKGLKQGGAALIALIGIDAIDGKVDGFGLFSSSDNTSRANNGGYHSADDIRTPSKDGYNDGDYHSPDNNSGGGGGYNHGNRAYNGGKYGGKTTLSGVMRTPSKKATFAGF